MDAIAGALLDHVPPGGVATKVTDEPAHTVLLPEITAPDITVTIFVVVQPPTV
jgi:hypothetical protein